VTIRRAPRPESKYLQIRNDVIDDQRLSLKALAILIKILRRPDHWRTDRETLASQCREGVTTVRTALKELSAAGYLVHNKYQDERGHWITESIIYDTPPDGSLENPPGASGMPPETGGGKSTSGVTRQNVKNFAKPQVAPEAGSPTADSPPVKELTLREEKELRETSEVQSPDQPVASSQNGSAAASSGGFPRVDVEILCQHLADWVVRNGSTPPKITDKYWRTPARLLLEKDGPDRNGRPLDKAMALVDWCQNHSFWHTNVRSMEKFRAQYDAMRLQANAEWEAAQLQPARPQPGRSSYQAYQDPDHAAYFEEL
jgi:hypothetical protein